MIPDAWIEKGFMAAVGAVVMATITGAWKLIQKGRQAEGEEVLSKKMESMWSKIDAHTEKLESLGKDVAVLSDRQQTAAKDIDNILARIEKIATHVDERFDKFETKIINLLNKGAP